MLGRAETKAEVVHVGTLAAGIERVGQGDIDLILLDLNLPDSEGLDTVRKMLEKAGKIPIVVLTVTHDKKQAIEAVKMGVQDYLIKGDFDSNILHRSIHYALARTSK